MNISKANKYTAMLIAVGALVISTLSLIECSRGDISGPLAQGGVMLIAALVFIALIAILGFPRVYRFSTRLPFKPILGFGTVLVLVILVVAGFVTLVLAAIGFGFSPGSLLRMYAIQFLLFSLATIPLAIFWLAIARKT